MKRRRRASDAERSANASSIWPSIALSAPPRRPISLVPPPGSTRRERSPAPIAAAVSSMRRSGRRLAVMSQSPSSSAVAMTAQATSSSIHLSWSSVFCVSFSGTPRISVESANGTERASRRKSPPLPCALTVARRAPPSLAGAKPFGMRGFRRRLAGSGERALDPRRAVTRSDLDIHARREHPELRKELDAAQRRARPGPAGAEALGGQRARDARGARVERAVDAVEERGAERRVGGDVGREQARRREHGEDGEQAGAQRHPAYRRSDAPAAAAACRHYRSGSRST